MGELSYIESGGRAAVAIEVPPQWADHHFQGRAVLPAVEAMQLLAHWARRHRPGLDVHSMGAATFDRFLELPPTGGRVEAWCEMKDLADGGLRAALLTKTRSKSSRMTRTRVHAKLDFYPAVDRPAPAALDLASALEGVCINVDPRRLYEELVPFGPAYQTICRPMQITSEGALAVIRAPDMADEQTERRLGSPFVLDGAFHAACAWSQRFAGVVAFPVGIDKRLLIAPTRPGETYVARIFPARTESAMLTFDIWILDGEGRPFEMVEGVRMRDVSGGRLQPPDWIRSREGDGLMGNIACDGAAVAMIERATLMPFANRCLAEPERRRTFQMGDKRLTDYLSARLACKRLSRRLSGDDTRTPARDIVTLAADGIRPHCPVVDGSTYYCSVSHDRRFALAVAGKRPMGVDVEPIDEKVLKGLRLFMDTGEEEMVRESRLGLVGAALRVWTTKEAAAKMLNVDLADAWARTRLLAVEAERSYVRITDGPAAAVVHQSVEDHLITLVYAV
jgi:phosphopantetheinyl transferase